MEKVVIVSAVRTPLGKFGGQLEKVALEDLGAAVIEKAIADVGIDKELIDEVLLGNVLSAGKGQNPARQASVKAGLSYEVPASSINVVCGSGLHSVNIAAKMIRNGEADIIVAGGMEHMSSAPHIINCRKGKKLGEINLEDSILNDGLIDAFNKCHMGQTVEHIAEKYEIHKEESDEFAISSIAKANKNKDKLKKEIVPINVNNILVSEDEIIELNISKIKKLKPVFKKNGVLTAANSSSLSDGAAVVLLMSESKAIKLGIKPLVIWETGDLIGLDPMLMGVGPVKIINKMLNTLKLSIEDIDLFEINEAFSAQCIAVINEVGIDSKKVNVNGGAIALGHPLGASGCRILVTLIHEMLRRDKGNYGSASLCVGGGMGCGVIVKKY